MKQTPTTPERARLLLNQWRKSLVLTNLEESQLAGAQKILDSQLDRLNNKCLRIAVFGRVGVGKSSLLNALLGTTIFETDVAHGSTRRIKIAEWNQKVNSLNKIELMDTPGIDEISAAGRARLATRVARQADLVLLVLDSDITRVELEALKTLIKSKKPLLLVLNRSDQWEAQELTSLVKSIKSRLPINAPQLEIKVVAASPRKATFQENGQLRSEPCTPRIKSLRDSLKSLVAEKGELFLALNSLKQAAHFYELVKIGRVKRRKVEAQSLIGKYAAIKASGVAANPLLLIDLAGGLACDTALIIQLSKVYGLQMGGHSARKLLKQLSIHNAFIGGAQVGIQGALGVLRHLLIISTPLTNGISLVSAAPIALVQAALAVHTTKLTGRLATKVLVRGLQSKEIEPTAMIKRLALSDPAVKHLLVSWPEGITSNSRALQPLLP